MNHILDFRLRAWDDHGNESIRWFRTHRGAVQAGRHAERTGQFPYWEVMPGAFVA